MLAKTLQAASSAGKRQPLDEDRIEGDCRHAVAPKHGVFRAKAGLLREVR